jgi:hypothetical protein
VWNYTTKVTQDWVAMNGADSKPGAWALNAGEKFVQGLDGLHAEQNILRELGNDWEVIEGGTSRNVCFMCADEITPEGLDLGGPVFNTVSRMFGAVTEGRTLFRMFWRL